MQRDCLAGSSTWSDDPATNDWNTGANWVPHTVPNGPADVATFGTSNLPEISLSATVRVASIGFNVGADAFRISVNPLGQLAITGTGITNDSGIEQNFVTGTEFSGNPGGSISFTDTSTAGSLAVFTNNGSIEGATGNGNTQFQDSSTAGNAVFINGPGGIVGGATVFSNFSGAGTASFTCQGGSESGGGLVLFENSSTAANGTFLLEGATSAGGGSGFMIFENSATADHATFTLEGGRFSRAEGGQVIFSNASTADNALISVNGTDINGAEGGQLNFFSGTTAGNATIVVNGGSAAGGICSFEAGCDGGTARLQIFGNGTLSIVTSGQITLGSIEGDGIFGIDVSNVFVGRNNLSTTFSGTIGPAGAFHKIGTGTLTLSGSNTYDGGTVVDAGSLLIANQTGSGTGLGPVSVIEGTLGGPGIIAGTVVLGTSSGSGAFLAPAGGSKKQATLTIQSGVTLNSDATYTYTFKAKKNKAKTDKVIANGVTINGASVNLTGQTQGNLKRGLRLTLISNTSTNPISGTFSNLPDGGIITINGNKFQASYQGGDGNDLILTVVP